MDNCPELKISNNIVYSDLFSSVEKQKKCAELFLAIIETKERLYEKKLSDETET